MVEQRDNTTLPALAAVAGSFGSDVERGLRRSSASSTGRAPAGPRWWCCRSARSAATWRGGDGLDAAPGAGRRRPGDRAARGYRRRRRRVRRVHRGRAGRPLLERRVRDGDGVIGHHRKVHLPPSEVGAFTPGDSFRAFDTPVGRVGMLICYDKVFPRPPARWRSTAPRSSRRCRHGPCAGSTPAARICDDRQTRQFNLLDQARASRTRSCGSPRTSPAARRRCASWARRRSWTPTANVLARTGGRAGCAVARVDVRGEVDRRARSFSHLADMAPARTVPSLVTAS